MSRQVSEWWNKLKPETQRRHIKRHPNGKYARWVKSGDLTLKKLRNQSDEDYEKEREGLVEKATGPAPDINGGATDDVDEGDEPSSDAPPTPPTPPTPADQNQIRDASNSYRRSLPQKFKGAFSAFVRSWNGEPLGQPASTQDLDRAAAQGPNAVVDTLRPRDDQARTTLQRTVKALMPLAKIAALGTLGLAGAAVTGSTLPLMLVSYYINHTLSVSESSSGANDAEVNEDKDVDTLVNSFMQYVNELQEHRQRLTSAPASEQTVSESAALTVRLRPCPVAAYRIEQGAQTYRYVIVVCGKIRGTIQYDKALGDPDTEANGWYTVLFHGFNANAFPTQQQAGYQDPYTKVTAKGLRLVNPARMPLDFCLRWARQNIRR